MLIHKLHFLAYGPFRRVNLDFSSKPCSLHIVYGPNEAGKSSALNGLLDFLFEFPHSTNAGFVFDNTNLRMGAEIELPKSGVLSLVRKKGKKNSLLSEDGQPVDPGFLESYLENLDRKSFELQFGISYQQLLEGGRLLSQGKGDLAQTLFSATAGSSSWVKVRKSLIAKAEEIFKSRGVNQRLPKNLKEYNSIKESLADCQLDPSVWSEKKNEIGQLDLDLKKLTERIEELRRKKSSLVEKEKGRPLLDRFKKLKTEVGKFEFDFEKHRRPVGILAERNREMKADRMSARTLADELKTIEKLLGEISDTEKASSFRDQVTRQSAQLVGLKGNWQSYIEKLDQRTKLENQDFRQVDGQEFPEDRFGDLSRWIDILEKEAVAKSRIEEAKNRKKELETQKEGWDLSANQPEGKDPAEAIANLNVLVSAINQQSAIQNRFLEKQKSVAEELVKDFLNCGLNVNLENVHDKEFPLEKVIKIRDQFEENSNLQKELTTKKKELIAKIDQIEKQLSVDSSSIDTVSKYQELLSFRDQTLQRIRLCFQESKDLDRESSSEPSGEPSKQSIAAWVGEVCKKLQLDDVEVDQGEHSLVSLLAEIHRTLDQTVSLMIRDTKSIHRVEVLEQEKKEIQEELQELEKGQGTLHSKAESLETQWSSIWSHWSSVPKFSEMAALIEVMEDQRVFAQELSEKATAAQTWLNTYSESFGILEKQGAELLGKDSSGEGLESLYDFSQLIELSDSADRPLDFYKFHELLPAVEEKLKKLSERFQTLKMAEEQRKAGLKKQSEWTARFEQVNANIKEYSASLQELQEQGQVDYQQVKGFIDVEKIRNVEFLKSFYHDREKVSKHAIETKRLNQEIASLTNELSTGIRQTQNLVAEYAKVDPLFSTFLDETGFQVTRDDGLFLQEFDESDTNQLFVVAENLERFVLEAFQNHEKRKSASSKRDDLASRLEQLKERISESLRSAAEVLQVNQFVSQELSGEVDSELESLLETSDRVGKEVTRIEGLFGEFIDKKKELDECHRSLTDLGLNENDDLAVDGEGEDVEKRSREIEVEIKELESRANELREVKAVKQEQLEEQEQSQRAQSLKQELSTLGGTIQDDLIEYLEYKFSEVLLDHAMRAFSKEHQHPVIPLASDYFQQLTCGGFSGISTDFDDSGKQILWAMRDQDTRVTVSGLSEGSETQLYLALRLAILKNYLDEGKKMPFVLDDVLKDYDDHRSESALKLFATIGEQTQVILFTHHQHLLEIAKSSMEPGTYQIHQLQSGHSPAYH